MAGTLGSSLLCLHSLVLGVSFIQLVLGVSSRLSKVSVALRDSPNLQTEAESPGAMRRFRTQGSEVTSLLSPSLSEL